MWTILPSIICGHSAIGAMPPKYAHASSTLFSDAFGMSSSHSEFLASSLISVCCVLAIASFQPKSKGTYTVEVTQDGKAIGGSPFKINIDDHHVSNSQKVKVAGHIKDGMANQWNDVTVNIAEAGTLFIVYEFISPRKADSVEKHRTETYDIPYNTSYYYSHIGSGIRIFH